MKRKYQGIVGMGTVLLLMLVICGYYQSGRWHVTPTFISSSQVPLSDGWTPSEKQVTQMDRLAGALRQLAVPTSRDSDPSPLFIFGQRSKSLGVRKESDPEEERVYELSLTLLAGPVRYCIVDGLIATEGNRLPDGGAVIKIENNRVLIAKDRTRQWLYLQDPTQTTNRGDPFLHTKRKDRS